ncbi:hypothetical protein PAS25_20100 [Leclercia adecarboxylata]|uniref:hypothetical protein n=1 Tax=Leclercia adecarboxylata TaxID=83655 RepID=UPI001117E6A4|nr:hypothetical protein [Leclercia adecarboxylata]QCZ29511.1 hypothetical protein FHN83_23965 [Leclercia adecarboxylata]
MTTRRPVQAKRRRAFCRVAAEALPGLQNAQPVGPCKHSAAGRYAGWRLKPYPAYKMTTVGPCKRSAAGQ